MGALNLFVRKVFNSIKDFDREGTIYHYYNKQMLLSLKHIFKKKFNEDNKKNCFDEGKYTKDFKKFGVKIFIEIYELYFESLENFINNKLFINNDIEFLSDNSIALNTESPNSQTNNKLLKYKRKTNNIIPIEFVMLIYLQKNFENILRVITTITHDKTANFNNFKSYINSRNLTEILNLNLTMEDYEKYKNIFERFGINTQQGEEIKFEFQHLYEEIFKEAFILYLFKFIIFIYFFNDDVELNEILSNESQQQVNNTFNKLFVYLLKIDENNYNQYVSDFIIDNTSNVTETLVGGNPTLIQLQNGISQTGATNNISTNYKNNVNINLKPILLDNVFERYVFELNKNSLIPKLSIFNKVKKTKKLISRETFRIKRRLSSLTRKKTNSLNASIKAKNIKRKEKYLKEDKEFYKEKQLKELDKQVKKELEQLFNKKLCEFSGLFNRNISITEPVQSNINKFVKFIKLYIELTESYQLNSTNKVCNLTNVEEILLATSTLIYRIILNKIAFNLDISDSFNKLFKQKFDEYTKQGNPVLLTDIFKQLNND